MRQLNDFRCDTCGLMEERFVQPDSTPECTACGGPCSKVTRAPRIALDPISGDFPGATIKWEGQRRQKMYRETLDSRYCPKQDTIILD